MIVKSLDDIPNKEYKEALLSLLYQLADDDFILAYRGSEWLGLAPHIEEDVAFSSINQDTMGHATMYYQLLEELGEGSQDSLAHARPSGERRNAVLLEEVNGTGDYLTEPRYDWAFTVVRNYFYSVAKKVRIDSLKNSSYEPLADLAIKINTELYYHLLHWKTWFLQLVNAGGEAGARMKEAMERVLDEFQGVLTLGPQGKEMSVMGLIEGEENLKKRWELALQPVFQSANLAFPPKTGMKKGDGRQGEHTSELDQALSILSEVYNSDPAAIW
ncbi:1,2-phenylacetyl-CoA epoxidase subunit PaaC [[Bacillus] enclensis]|jgi:ring-1,2-phenylacetyl-CoA epoxidase subunit PaaC|uniref:1,2-phenylacetyl-CoA epoxidase subunit PaaC n=1 Tax=[Bacillus] enclensis TaxID=1402860 RepID=UPI0018DC1479|nr:1,2-phenylacetyl-CoA epoxidase subunit PaaC [[Bacillus] enclensis]MBH9967592.1 phenylacetate-CoA oxygenase subunit PaaC [[Bacillus] enclensis]QWC23219.1 phenylacetate-CoA oxygenase subunit PaaC [Bacillus haikouensis]